jgi:hypothetical protein
VRLFPTSTKTRRADCFGVPSWTRGACGTRAETWGRSSLSPAVRLHWPPPADHASAPGPAPLVASPRLRAGRRLWATSAHVGNRITLAHGATAMRLPKASAMRPRQPPASANAVATWREFPPPARCLILSRPAMEFSLRSAPPFRPSAFPLARSDQAPRSATSAVAGRAATGQRAECALITGQGSPDRVRTGAWPHDPIHL